MNRADRCPLLFMTAGILLLIAAIACVIEVASRPPARVEMAAARPAPAPEIEAYFSPRGGCTQALVELIGSARKRIRVQAYSFTSRPIADALIAAHRRGVEVIVLLDKEQRTLPYSLGAECRRAGISVLYDAAHAIAHNKVAIVDARAVASGSFNFSTGAETRNAENLLIIRDAATASAFAANWAAHREHSEP